MSVHRSRERLGKVVRERAYVLRDGHVVVVQHDEQVRRQGAGVIEGLEGHAGGEGAVTDHGSDAPAVALTGCRDRHSESRAYRGARVSNAEGVVFALLTARERRQPTGLLYCGQTVAPAR